MNPALTHLSPSGLAELEDDALILAVIGYIERITQGLDPLEASNVVASLPDGLRAVYAATVVDNEIMNGGFLQMFWNPSGIYAEMAIEGLAHLGATELSRTVGEAVARVVPLLDSGAWRELRGDESLAAFEAAATDDMFDDLDDRYYELTRDSGVDELVTRFIREHPEAVAHGHP